jgi:hypothetical protein
VESGFKFLLIAFLAQKKQIAGDEEKAWNASFPNPQSKRIDSSEVNAMVPFYSYYGIAMQDNDKENQWKP